MFIEWNEKYSLGIPTIDQQHKKLIDLFNTLNQSLEQGNSGEIYLKKLEELADYARYHFSTEENFMEKFSFDGLERHKAEHKEFAEKIKELRDEKLTLEAPFLVVKIVNFLWDWFALHIQGTDKLYAPILLKNGVK